jgi:hypothetical protein
LTVSNGGGPLNWSLAVDQPASGGIVLTVRSTPRADPLLLIGVGLGAFVLVHHATVGFFDEGAMLTGAWRLGGGAWPYRDFWTAYAPGQYAVLGLLFALLEPSVSVARAWDALVRSGLAVVAYVLARDVTGSRWALGAWALTLAVLLEPGLRLTNPIPALLLALASLRLAIRVDAGRPGRLAIGTGALAGLTALFRLDFGIVAAGAALVAMAFADWSRPPAGTGAGRLPLPIRGGVLAIAAGTTVVGLAAAVLFWAMPLETIWRHVVNFPARLAESPFRLPPPRLLLHPRHFARADLGDWLSSASLVHRWLRYWLPILVLALAASRLRRLIARPPGDAIDGRRRRALAGCLALGLGLLPYATFSSDWPHTLPLCVVAAVLALALAHEAAVPRGPLVIRWGLSVALVVAGAVLAAPPLAAAARTVREVPTWRCASSLPRAGCARVSGDQALAIARIRALVPPDEPLFVGLARHDDIFVNDVAFYFLAGRAIPTRYHEMPRVLVTGREAQESLVADLERTAPRWIVRWGGAPGLPTAKVGGASRVLDEYLARRYEPSEVIGDYAIWRRRDKFGPYWLEEPAARSARRHPVLLDDCSPVPRDQHHEQLSPASAKHLRPIDVGPTESIAGARVR